MLSTELEIFENNKSSDRSINLASRTTTHGQGSQSLVQRRHIGLFE